MAIFGYKSLEIISDKNITSLDRIILTALDNNAAYTPFDPFKEGSEFLIRKVNSFISPDEDHFINIPMTPKDINLENKGMINSKYIETKTQLMTSLIYAGKVIKIINYDGKGNPFHDEKNPLEYIRASMIDIREYNIDPERLYKISPVYHSIPGKIRKRRPIIGYDIYSKFYKESQIPKDLLIEEKQIMIGEINPKYNPNI